MRFQLKYFSSKRLRKVLVQEVQDIKDVCSLSPSVCGPFSQCKDFGDIPICSCLPGYLGHPPNCKPECLLDDECPSIKSCLDQKCVDVCADKTCGLNAECLVIRHVPLCFCLPEHSGDPFIECSRISKIMNFSKSKNI